MTPPQFRIRPATPADVDQITDAQTDSIYSLGSMGYGSDIISAWGAPRRGDGYRRNIEEGSPFFVAVKTVDARERVLGFSWYVLREGKHRTGVYVRGEAVRMGVGTALLLAAQCAAREHGAEEIHVNASLVAVKFYKHNGFEDVAPGQHRLNNGILMDCVFMRKNLQNLPPRA